MFLGRSFFMYQIVCITFTGRTTIVKLKHLIIPTFQYTLLYDSEEGFNQHCLLIGLLWSPMQAQQPMDEMWGKSHEVKNTHVEDTRGHLFEPKSVIRLLCANKLSFCHLPFRFSVAMEPHCALKTERHLNKNKSCYHHNANDRFGFILAQMRRKPGVLLFSESSKSIRWTTVNIFAIKRKN